MIRTRRHPTGDERGSLAIAMLISLVGVMLAMLLLPMLLVQVRATHEAADRVRSLHAAQAGLDSALSAIRGAADSTHTGMIELLPCGPVSGALVGGDARFSVDIYYLASDPRGMTDAWITANRIKCVAGGGAFGTPSYALLRARGTSVKRGAIETVTGRDLSATYMFKTTNETIPGGLIHGDWEAAGPDLCMDAGSSSPAVAAPVRVQTCSPGSAQQIWAYEKNMTLRLNSSRIPSRPLGLCVDAGPTQDVGDPVVLQPCGATTEPQQQWGYNTHARYEGSVDTKSCLGVPGGAVEGSSFALGKCTAPLNDGGVALRPEEQVGSGAAGESSAQLVNFDQFGRCLDVPLFKPDLGFLIIWQCKQAADPADVGWNQHWSLPAEHTSGQISSTTDGVHYCLTTPAAPGPGKYPYLQPCPALADELTTWTVTRNTRNYTTSYRVEDRYGNCLSPDITDHYTKNADRIIMNVCNGSTLQKWNAPPGLGEPAYKDIDEK